jgi:hypothetical protein
MCLPYEKVKKNENTRERFFPGLFVCLSILAETLRVTQIETLRIFQLVGNNLENITFFWRTDALQGPPSRVGLSVISGSTVLTSPGASDITGPTL